jgi:putative photosynthetic complex assembly protein
MADTAFPRGPLIAVGALLLTTLAAVGAARLDGATPRVQPDAPAVSLRELRFEDRPDGSIAVIDARDGQLVQRVEGESGFVRGTLRGLARERQRMGHGPQQPFHLVQRADGRLTLIDPVSGARVDLESFGPTNAGHFARWVSPARSTP